MIFFVQIQKNISLANLSSFHVGGNADELLIFTDSDEEIKYLKNNQKPLLVLGKGTNMLFSDQGFRGIIIKIENNEIIFKNNSIKVGAGILISDFVKKCAENNYDFSDFTWPGTIGGAIFGNAGTQTAISDYLISAEIFDLNTNEIKNYPNKCFDFAYRYSKLKENKNLIVLSAIFKLPNKNNSKEISEKYLNNIKKRTENQPKGFSAGSFFKNPEPGKIFAGKLIEEAGLKGLSMNDAVVSEKHANFIINQGKATQKDIINLAQKIINRVFEKSSIILEPEVQIIDEFGEIIEIKPN